MKNEIYYALKEFTTSVDECRQAAFKVRNVRGSVARRHFEAFDCDLSAACSTFVENIKKCADEIKTTKEMSNAKR